MFEQELKEFLLSKGVSDVGFAFTDNSETVYAFIDRMLLEAGLFLQSKGYNYITVAASQSMPGTPFNGRYSHKEAARKAGLGGIGKNSLFIHKE